MCPSGLPVVTQSLEKHSPSSPGHLVQEAALPGMEVPGRGGHAGTQMGHTTPRGIPLYGSHPAPAAASLLA